MRHLHPLLMLSVAAFSLFVQGQSPTGTGTAAAESKPADGPTDPKALKTFNDALILFKKKDYIFALDEFRKADKQDGGKCIPCEIKAYQSADNLQNYKAAREQTDLLLAHMPEPASQAQLHYLAGETCMSEGTQLKHDKAFAEASAEFEAALKSDSNFGPAQLDLAETLLESGDVKDAIPWLQRAEQSASPAVVQRARELARHTQSTR